MSEHGKDFLLTDWLVGAVRLRRWNDDGVDVGFYERSHETVQWGCATADLSVDPVLKPHNVYKHSFQHHLDLSGKHSAMLQLLCEEYSFTYPPPSTAK